GRIRIELGEAVGGGAARRRAAVVEEPDEHRPQLRDLIVRRRVDRGLSVRTRAGLDRRPQELGVPAAVELGERPAGGGADLAREPRLARVVYLRVAPQPQQDAP